MRNSKLMLVAVLGVFGTQMAGAAPTAEEAAQLGKTLTPFGAIKAGNKDGTIPEWTGGLCKPPAGYKPLKGMETGGGPYVDPYADEKPLFKITAANMAQYAEKLDLGTRELFKRYPKTYYIQVYPSHRSACFPDYAYENTIKNVMRPRIVGGNLPSVTGAHAQVPFPIPKMGVEAMWNANTKYVWPNQVFRTATWLVDSSGNNVDMSTQVVYQAKPYWDNSLTMIPEDKPFWTLIANFVAPASQAGNKTDLWKYLRQDQKGSPAWSYIPGQRRVRMAPEFSYDGVSTSSAGILLYDEINGFDGNMDRFDFKLMGRKEMYIPYNTYEFSNTSEDVNTPNHIDMSTLRYELHRVWMVEATLKPGERHVMKKKVFYIDEDSWNIIVTNGIDHSGNVQHLQTYTPVQCYDKPELLSQENLLYDFSRGAYLHSSKPHGIGANGEALYGISKRSPYPPNYFSPDSMAGMGVR